MVCMSAAGPNVITIPRSLSSSFTSSSRSKYCISSIHSMGEFCEGDLNVHWVNFLNIHCEFCEGAPKLNTLLSASGERGEKEVLL